MSHVPQPPLKLSLDDFLRNFVFVSKDSLVIRLRPYGGHRLRDFKNTYLPSGEAVEQWLRHPDRKTVEMAKCLEGCQHVFMSDRGRPCLNTWPLINGGYKP